MISLLGLGFMNKIKQFILLFLAIVVIVGSCVVVRNSRNVTIDQNKQDKPNIDLSTFKRTVKDTVKIDSLKR